MAREEGMRYTAILAAILAVGCASPGEMRARQEHFRATIPMCTGEADCRVKWEAAQVWVSQHIPMKIQTVTDVLIVTYGPMGTDATSAARVTKRPLGGGRYEIDIWVGCGNPFGCFPEPWATCNAFNDYVNTVGP
jgi:hypothetical protein